MRKFLFLLLTILIFYPQINSTAKDFNYDIAVVDYVETWDNTDYWHIIYNGNEYLYTDLEFPITTELLIVKTEFRIPEPIDYVHYNFSINRKTRTDIIIGMVSNKNGDGKEIADFEVLTENGNIEIVKNKVNPDYNYISYKSLNFHNDSIFQTVLTMNANNREPDDIINRYDYIIK